MKKTAVVWKDNYLKLGDYVHLKGEPDLVYYEVTQLDRMDQYPDLVVVAIMDKNGNQYAVNLDDIDIKQ